MKHKRVNRIVPEATFKRRRERLSAAESERTERIARVMSGVPAWMHGYS